MQVLFCIAPTHLNYESYEAMHMVLQSNITMTKMLFLVLMLMIPKIHDKEDVSPIPSSGTKHAGSNIPNGFKEIDDRRSDSRRIDSRKSSDIRRSNGRSDSRRSVDASKEEVGIEQLLLFEHGSSHLHDITS
jgi:hypothetical protein